MTGGSHRRSKRTWIDQAEEDRESIFEPFFRTRQARRQASPGTGLGLALAQHIATALRLELHCESRLGEGSRFVLSIPSR